MTHLTLRARTRGSPPSPPATRAERASRRKRRPGLDAPTPVQPRHDVDRLESAEQRAVLAPTAEFHFQVHLVLADMDRRALVPGAVVPAVPRSRAEIGQLVVAAVLPDADLAARQPDMREVTGRVDGGLVAAIEARPGVGDAG